MSAQEAHSSPLGLSLLSSCCLNTSAVKFYGNWGPHGWSLTSDFWEQNLEKIRSPNKTNRKTDLSVKVWLRPGCWNYSLAAIRVRAWVSQLFFSVSKAVQKSPKGLNVTLHPFSLSKATRNTAPAFLTIRQLALPGPDWPGASGHPQTLGPLSKSMGLTTWAPASVMPQNRGDCVSEMIRMEYCCLSKYQHIQLSGEV